MRALHFKILVSSGDSFKALRRAMEELAFESGMERGFVMGEGSPSRVNGKFYYVKTSKTKSIDRKTLKPVEEKSEALAECRFGLDLQHGLVHVEERRGELNALFEALDAMPDVGIEFADLNVNIKDYVFELQRAYNKNEIRNLRIKDYLARENMLASATFKMLDVREGEKLCEKFALQLDAATLSFKLPSGRCQFTVTRKGSLRHSDDTPQELVDYARELLPRFHEAEVETTEIRDPVAAQRKRGK
ncbi:MAG: hypothetical protein HPKKFMNG_01979 [Planctomycetes bacterium]|nr:hypothetical protein [Planctomycetota bacterium]HRJ77916.1 hypothetical protein [Planctomycetota bacterium]